MKIYVTGKRLEVSKEITEKEGYHLLKEVLKMHEEEEFKPIGKTPKELTKENDY